VSKGTRTGWPRNAVPEETGKNNRQQRIKTQFYIFTGIWHATVKNVCVKLDRWTDTYSFIKKVDD